MEAAGSSSFMRTTGWAAVLDVGAVHNGNISDFNLDSTFINFLAGPRVSIARSKRVSPYFQALFGGVYGSSSTRVIGFPIVSPLDTGLPVVTPDLPVTHPLQHIGDKVRHDGRRRSGHQD